MEIFEQDERTEARETAWGVFEVAETTGRTAADDYEGESPEVRQFLSMFEV